MRPLTRTTLITGGGSGIGLRLAQLLVDRGEQVAVLDRVPGTAGALQIECDVTDGAAVQQAVERVRQELGPLRLVINSAGIQHAAPFHELTEEDFRRIVDVNLVGSRNVAAAAWPHVEHLVLIASLAGLVANFGYAGYCASKYGVIGLAEVLRLEGKPRGITVSCVCPPEVETPMVERERLTQPPESKALKAFAGTMGIDTAAAQILAGIDRKQFLILPGKARRTRLISRVLPHRAAHAVSDRIVRRAQQ
jgi:NAD(P)-dependent dehydrogenase (short-subunit alcohol dehydrogenase family)